MKENKEAEKQMIMRYDKTQSAGTLTGGGNGEPATIWILADPHYLSPKLFDVNSGSFQTLTEMDYGKLIEAVPQLMEEFVSLALDHRPDAVFLAGDLTLNGELESLREMRVLLERIRSAGIPILVIPGNHDINHPRTACYTGEKPSGTSRVQKEHFIQEMKQFGYSDSISQAPDSFSYCYPIHDGLRILTLDANTEKAPCALSEETLAWAEEQLQKAKKDGCTVITASHQNLLVHNEQMNRGFVMNNREEVTRILRSCGVRLHLSAHAHLQSMKQGEDLCDICTESAAISPLGFGVLEITGDHTGWRYHKQLFQQYQSEAKQRLYATVKRMSAEAIPENACTEEERRIMLELGEELAVSYFGGTICPLDTPERREAVRLWKNLSPATHWSEYIVSIIGMEEASA